MIGRLFRHWRKPAPQSTPAAPDDCRNMNEDWKPGDLAECIDDGWSHPNPHCPKVGDVLRVSAVLTGITQDSRLIYALKFVGKPGTEAFETVCFRKLRPVQEPAEAKWAQWLKDTLRTPEHVR